MGIRRVADCIRVRPSGIAGFQPDEARYAVEAEPDRTLFAAVERLDLDGVVAKRLVDPYTPDTVWRKVRTGPTPKWRDGENCSVPEVTANRGHPNPK